MLLIRVPVINELFKTLAVPVIPLIKVGLSQLKRVDAGTISLNPFTGEMVNAEPLQLVTLNGETEGVGFTVTVTVKVLPIQFPETADTR